MKSASLTCVGSGGLRFPSLLQLAAAGDQQLQWGGRSKAHSVEARVQDLKTYCQVEVHEDMLDVGDALDLIFNCMLKSPNNRDWPPELLPLESGSSCSEAGMKDVMPGLIGVL